jgi:hypothetical protein
MTATVLTVAALAPAAGAQASALISNIETPETPAYLIATPSHPTFSVAGTSNATSGDEFDIRCFYDGDSASKTVATAVPVAADGSFATSASTAGLGGRLCHLAAVPTGAPPLPAGLADNTGPVLAVSEDFPDFVGTGPNAGTLYDYYFYGQQRDAAFDYYSAADCGVGDGYLFDPERLERTTMTFFCNDAFSGSGRNGQTRSAIQVDDANAYTAADVPGVETADLPAISYTYSQDPASGDLTIEEIDQLVSCPGTAYPPTEENCPSFVDTGVTLERTIVQSDDGHMSIATDHFRSTDGEPHTIDTRPENAQDFSYPHSIEIEYSFPGAATVTSPNPGESVSFDDSAPGSVYLKVAGSADGDQGTGRGAIVFGEPASPATFTARRLYESSFYFHQTATVPAGGVATKRFAYIQAYDQAEVEALAHKAEAAFAAQPAPTSGGGGQTAAQAPPAQTSLPSNRIGILRTKLDKKTGTALLTLKVPAAGSLALSGKKVKAAKRNAKRPSTVTLTVSAKRRFARTLGVTGRLRVAVKISFTPDGGTTGVVKRTLKLIRR